MPKYLITEKAGTFVAGHRNNGVGSTLDLPAVAAEYELTLGTLVPAEEAAPVPAGEPEAAETEAPHAAEPEAAPADEAPADAKPVPIDDGPRLPVREPATGPQPLSPAARP